MAAGEASFDSSLFVCCDRDVPGFRPGSSSTHAARSALVSAEVQFSRCFNKLKALRSSDSPGFRTELNLLFDQLISENYSSSFISDNIRPQDVCELLVHASRLVSHKQEHLVVKLCQLIHQLLNQLQVIVDEQALDALVSYCTRALHTCNPWTRAEVLLALSSVVYANGARCQEHLPHLLGQDGVLLKYGDSSQTDVELRCSAVQCMANLCVSVPGNTVLEEPYRGVCYRIFLQTLQTRKPPSVEDLVYCTLLQSALKGMQYFVNGGKWKDSPDQDLGSLLAVLKKFMFHGLPGISVEMPPVLYPAPLPQYDAVPVTTVEPEQEVPAQRKTPVSQQNKKRKSRGKGKKARAEGKTDEAAEEGEDEEPSPRSVKNGAGGGPGRAELQNACPQTLTEVSVPLQPRASPQLYPSWKKGSSDSEFSDPEGGMASKLRLYLARVRQSALHCFLAVVKCVEKKVLYGYWSSFIPDAPGIGSPPSLTLVTIALKDPSPKVRAASLQVLSALLEGSRQFLSAAEDTSAPRQAFTPFSATLAASLRELHRCLLLALLAELSCQTLTQIIKCLAHLVSNVPYRRLRPGLLSPLWKQIRPYIRHRDVNVRVSSLTLLGAILSAQAPLPEVQQLLKQPGIRERDASTLADVKGGEEAPCWLLQVCMALVTQPREDSCSDSDTTTTSGSLEPSPVRLEALQILAHMAKGYFCMAQASLLELGQLSARCLSEQDPSVQLHGAKLLEELGTGIIQQYRAAPDTSESASELVPVTRVVQFWTEVLIGPLIGALQNEQHPTLQTSACDTLSCILPQAFGQLPDKTQVLCITILLGLTYSENTLVKATAARALGVYVRFPCLREDVMFVADTANAILTVLDDRSTNVRAKAAWSLGNLTDTLIINMETVGPDFQAELSDMLLLKMLQSATHASADKDRVKSNAMRSLGNLLHFLQPVHLSKPAFGQPLDQAMRALIDTARGDATMKVRWNACYALGNAFQNPALPLGTASWSSEAYSALSSIVTTCKNFKVRIKSAAALAVPVKRDCYGDACQFAEVWRALAHALEHSEETQDFLEYRYCASLRSELCRALLHLLSLCQARDLPAIGASLSSHSRPALHGFLVRYLTDISLVSGGEDAGCQTEPSDRLKLLNQTLIRLKDLEGNIPTETRSDLDMIIGYFEDVMKTCEGLKVSDGI